MVPTIVTMSAAIWLRVKVEANRPKPVENTTKSNAPAASVRKLPLTGTSKTVTASNVISPKLNMASAT